MFYFDLFSQGYVACFNKLLKINDKRLNTNSNFYTQINDWKEWTVSKIRNQSYISMTSVREYQNCVLTKVYIQSSDWQGCLGRGCGRGCFYRSYEVEVDPFFSFMDFKS